MGSKRALRPERDHDQGDADVEDSFRGPLVVEVGVEPREVGVARLHDRALGDHLVETGAVLVIRGDSRSDVGVEHHDASVVLALNQLGERGGHGLQDQAERPQVQRCHVWAEALRHHLAREVGG